MKKIITLLAIIGITVFSSCEGPEGIPGQDGQDGLIAEVFEVTALLIQEMLIAQQYH